MALAAAWGANTGSSLRSYSLALGLGTEYSVAYFGFDDKATLDHFIEKYDNFVVEVDHRRKYVLQVTRAIY